MTDTTDQVIIEQLCAIFAVGDLVSTEPAGGTAGQNLKVTTSVGSFFLRSRSSEHARAKEISYDHDLLSFLARTVEQSDGGLEVVVTGHSKGGALSTTVALWLADTQGTAGWIPEEERWDPQHEAEVSCYSFAGPTAGNAAFAAHYDAVIGERCHRVFNALDVVPHAWEAEDLMRVPGLYDPPIKPPPGMGRLAELIVRETRELGYTQIGNRVRRLNPQQHPDKKLYPDQLVHQHLQAYISELGLSHYMSQNTFFKI